MFTAFQILSLEYLLEIEQLRKIGLSEEEIEGYYEFFTDNYTDEKDIKVEEHDIN